MNKTLPTLAALALLVTAGCAGTGAATPSATATPSSTYPLLVTASGYVDYARTAATCDEGNAFAKGDKITLTDPAGTVVDTSKLVDSFEITDKAGRVRCQSGFALNALKPVDGDYVLTLGEQTMKTTAHQMNESLRWTIEQ